ncbi:hypothetical protein Ancab_039082 [Ancistrocladus abbreviatus]
MLYVILPSGLIFFIQQHVPYFNLCLLVDICSNLVVIWVSSISFHAYADVTFESMSDCGKGITNLKTALKDIFGENLVEEKDEFLKTFSTECQYISSIVSSGKKLHLNSSNGSNIDPNSHSKAEDPNVECTEVDSFMVSSFALVTVAEKGSGVVWKPFRNRAVCALLVVECNGPLSEVAKIVNALSARSLRWVGTNLASRPTWVLACILHTRVIHFVVGEMPVGLLYSRLFLSTHLRAQLSESGCNPIDVTDSKWELYLVVQKTTDQHEACQVRLLGFAAVYRFYRYPDSSRLRLSQILILPPYQHKGYGRFLLEVLNHVAISEDIYDFTIEEPLDSLQHIRNCIDIPRLLACSSVQHACEAVVSHLKEANLSKRTHSSQFLPPMSAVEDVRKSLKINKKHPVLGDSYLSCVGSN